MNDQKSRNLNIAHSWTTKKYMEFQQQKREKGVTELNDVFERTALRAPEIPQGALNDFEERRYNNYNDEDNEEGYSASRSPVPGAPMLYRGFTDQTLKVGESFHVKGYTSFSRSKPVAQNFALKESLMVLPLDKVAPGTPWLWFGKNGKKYGKAGRKFLSDGWVNSNNPEEKEVLLPPGTFRIISARKVACPTPNKNYPNHYDTNYTCGYTEYQVSFTPDQKTQSPRASATPKKSATPRSNDSPPRKISPTRNPMPDVNTGKVDAKKRKVFKDSKGRTYVKQGDKKVYVKKLFTPGSNLITAKILPAKTPARSPMINTEKVDAKKRKVFRDSKGRTYVKQDDKKVFVKKLFTPKKPASPASTPVPARSPMINTEKVNAKKRKVFKDSKGRTYVKQGDKKVYVKKLFTPERS